MKRIFALAVLFSVFLGLAGCVAESNPANLYYVGYAKVDINPYNEDTQDPNDLVAIPLAGYGFTTQRLSRPEKMDDNGDGIVDGNDGLFASCVAISDNTNASPLLIFSLDVGHAKVAFVDPMRAKMVAACKEVGIDLDPERILVNASHTHAGPDFNNAHLAGAAYSEAYVEYVDTLVNKLVQAGLDALADREWATMSKGSIEANEAACKDGPIGDTLNSQIRDENKKVTLLTKEDHPELYTQRTYNSVHQYSVTTLPALREQETSWTRSDGTGSNTETIAGITVGRYAYWRYLEPKYQPDTTQDSLRYYMGNNFNPYLEPGNATSRNTLYVDAEGNEISAEEYLGRAWEYENDISLEAPTGFWSADMWVVSETDHASETDDTMHILKFDFAEETKKTDIILVNWRAHPTENRRVSMDYRATPELSNLGFYTSYYQITSDYVNALRYTLEQAGYRTSFLQGCAGNINANSRITAENAWQHWYTLEETTPTYESSVCVEAAAGKPVAEVEGSTVAVVKDASHLRNEGNIYGSELAEVALECLEKHMVQINKDGGAIRSVQVKFQTERKDVPADELVAACHYKRTYNTSRPGNKNVYKPGQLSYWVYTDTGEILVDTATGYPKVAETPNADGTYTPRAATKPGTSQTYSVDLTRVEHKTNDATVVITSIHHANSVCNRYSANGKAAAKLELNAVTIGKEFALVTSPNELFERYAGVDAEGNYIRNEDGSIDLTKNLWDILYDDSQGGYGEPFILGYTNGYDAYMPSVSAFEYNTGMEELGYAQGCYESLTSQYQSGTGEKLVQQLAAMLDYLHTETSETAKTEQGSCTHCGVESVTWQVFPGDHAQLELSNLKSGHYYLDKDTTTTGKQTAFGANICLDLRGHTLTVNNGFNILGGSTLNLLGSGVVSGMEAPGNGGVFYVHNDAVLNLYEATVRYDGGDGAQRITNGGIVYVDGSFNMYGGELIGTDVSWTGGTMYVAAKGTAMLAGGKVTAGANAYVAPCIVNRGQVTVTGSAEVENMHLMPHPEADGPAHGDMLVFSGEYTGTMQITSYYKLTAGAEGDKLTKDIGNSDGADLSKANITARRTQSPAFDFIVEITDHNGDGKDDVIVKVGQK